MDEDLILDMFNTVSFAAELFQVVEKNRFFSCQNRRFQKFRSFWKTFQGAAQQQTYKIEVPQMVTNDTNAPQETEQYCNNIWFSSAETSG